MALAWRVLRPNAQHVLHCSRRTTSRLTFTPSPRCAVSPSANVVSQNLDAQGKFTRRRYASTAEKRTLGKTALHDLHVRHGGKMVPFAGFNMPVQYSDQSITESHLFTRSHASIFDVSHMVQHRLSGPGAQGLLKRITPSAVGSIEAHHSTLSALLLPGTGGIVDDCIITRLGPQDFYFVTNAACREKDLAFLTRSIEDYQVEAEGPIKHEVLEDHSLIALQGPSAPNILEQILVDMTPAELKKFYFGQSALVTLNLTMGNVHRDSSRLLISRGGYTGEDGFEISVPSSEADALVNTLLATAGPKKLRLAGLGARDTLRLEAGMCLYGHDLNEQKTPVEGALSWIIPKERRTEGGFNGDEVILRQIIPKSKGGAGVDCRRVGLMLKEGAPPAREGAKIEGKGEDLGNVTSGAPSPSLGRNIAMGYVRDGWHKAGTEVEVVVRGKKHKAEVTKMPFVPSRYWKGGVSPG